MSFWWLLLYNLRHYHKKLFKGFNGTIVASCNTICPFVLALFDKDDAVTWRSTQTASHWSEGSVWGKTSPKFESSYGIVQKSQFENMDPFFSPNSSKTKRHVRKLRKDSLLSEFSSHVVLGSNFPWIISAFTDIGSKLLCP